MLYHKKEFSFMVNVIELVLALALIITAAGFLVFIVLYLKETQKVRKLHKIIQPHDVTLDVDRRSDFDIFPVPFDRSWMVEETNKNPVNTTASHENVVGGTVAELHVYYHLCCIQHWKRVVSKMFTEMVHNRSFMRKVTMIHISMLAWSAEKEQGLKEILKKCGVLTDQYQIRLREAEANQFERPTLKMIREDAIMAVKQGNGNQRILYLHSKGVSHTTPSLVAFIDAWTNTMLYYLVSNYSLCSNLLQHHDVCGVGFRKDPSPHFSGNFWMTKAKYMSAMPKKIGDKYLDPEMYILGKENVKVCSLWNDVGGYAHIIQPKDYHDRFDIHSNVLKRG